MLKQRYRLITDRIGKYDEILLIDTMNNTNPTCGIQGCFEAALIATRQKNTHEREKSEMVTRIQDTQTKMAEAWKNYKVEEANFGKSALAPGQQPPAEVQGRANA